MATTKTETKIVVEKYIDDMKYIVGIHHQINNNVYHNPSNDEEYNLTVTKTITFMFCINYISDKYQLGYTSEYLIEEDIINLFQRYDNIEDILDWYYMKDLKPFQKVYDLPIDYTIKTLADYHFKDKSMTELYNFYVKGT